MILGFSTKWPKKMGTLAGEPTYFPESICKGFTMDNEMAEWWKGTPPKMHTGYPDWAGIHNSMPIKPHTIRTDAGKRWKVGMDIHFYIDVRKISMMRFAPVKKVTAIQELEIQWIDQDKCKLERPLVFIDGAWITDVTELALNDGFPTVEAFFTWFNTDFKGRIIHWTELRY
tara:strand:+ start:6631 stop:7146 length:516 start_codon:yes stop_codon:yes gene_type:complete